MGNIINHNFNFLKLKFDYEEYWDFFVCLDTDMGGEYKEDGLSDKCLIAYIDAEDPLCIEGSDLCSKSNYIWEEAVITQDYTLNNIGFTGFDNGLLTFRKDRIDNKTFIDLFTNSHYNVQEDARLRLHAVSGSNMLYDYPITIEETQIKLNGGFFQGFFETECDKYQVLPTKLNNGEAWHFEFVLKKEEFEKESNKTLNDKYPWNKGIFFYLGTRAENKWIYEYEEGEGDTCKIMDVDDYVDIEEHATKKNYLLNEFVDMSFNFNECSDDDFDYIEDDLDISDFIYETDNGIKLSTNNEYYFDTDNKFLTFDRTCDGFNVHNWQEGDVMRYYGKRNTYQGNLFLLMNRTCTGFNVNTIEEDVKPKYNIYKDLYNNALAFRITDDGAIGYRYVTLDCDSPTQVKIREAYSFDNVIKEGEWYTINVAVHASEKKMRLFFYVNGKLVFVTDEMDKIDLRALAEDKDKQETVPYNMSLGGGTQGLADAILPNYMLGPYKSYMLEENFGGSFIGYIRSFRFFNCSMRYERILNNFRCEKSKLTQGKIFI